MRHAANLSAAASQALWVATLFVGLIVFLPSQMSIVENFSRRWTDIIWSGNRRVREKMTPDKAKYIYYTILAFYVVWSFVAATIFLLFGDAPKVMVLVIANLNNIALGLTAFIILWNNHKLLPKELRPRWYNNVGVIGCGVFYLGLSLLVFIAKVLPLLTG